MKISTLFVLLEGKAFFPSVATLQKVDPLEGDLVPEPEDLMGKLTDVADKGTTLIRWLREKANSVEKTFLDADIEPHMCMKLLSQVYVRELAKRRAVWCWFHEQHESAGMWSVYGTAGIAVETKLENLTNALPSNFTFQIADINYVNRNNPGTSKNQDLIHRPHLLKGEEYKHEKEIRITTSCLPDESGRHVDGIDTLTLVKQIIISPLLPFNEVEAIKQQILRHRVWKQSPPSVDRSSILGRTAQEQQTNAEISDFFHKILVTEPELPPPLDEL